LIECRAVYREDRLPTPRGPDVACLGARRAHEPRTLKPAQHELVGNLGELRRLQRDDSRAVGGLADFWVFLEQQDVEAGFGETSGSKKSGGSTADDGDVDHGAIIGGAES